MGREYFLYFAQCVPFSITKSSEQPLGSLYPIMHCSSPVAHRVPEGEERRRRQQLLPHQEPLSAGHAALLLAAQQSAVVGGWPGRQQGGGEGAEPHEGLHVQRRHVVFRPQGECGVSKSLLLLCYKYQIRLKYFPEDD